MATCHFKPRFTPSLHVTLQSYTSCFYLLTLNKLTDIDIDTDISHKAQPPPGRHAELDSLRKVKGA